MLSAFIAGSSAPVFLPFLYSVSQIPDEVNFSYTYYAMLAPLYFGATSTLAAVLRSLGMSLFSSLLLVAIASALFVLYLVKTYRLYTFIDWRWKEYVVQLIIRHAVAYMTIFAIIKYVV